MEALKLKRKTTRNAFTRLYNILEEAAKTKVVKENLDCLATFQLITEKHNELLQLNEDILNNLLASEEVKEDDIEKETALVDEYSLKFKKLSLLIDYKAYSDVDMDARSSINTTKRKFKLPPLELKKFGGDIKSWLQFWGQFKKIDEDPDIDETDKFQYLVQATIPNSRARELVDSFPPSPGNYAKAIECLKSRFGKDDILVEYYVRELLKLTLAFNAKDKRMKLSIIYDRIETQLRSLETLGVTTAKYAAMLFPLVESCLSEEILRAWQRNGSGRMVDKKDAEEESRLESLMKFLKNEVENEDRIALAMEGFSLKENANYGKIKRDIPTAAGLFSGNRNSESLLKCVFCEKDKHEPKNCPLAGNLNLDEKMAKLKKRGCCFICLWTGHVSRKCRVRVNCENCGKRHHVVMCPNAKGDGSLSHKEATVVKNVENFNTLPNPTCSSSVFLQTLVVILRGENEDFAVRALIDTGSQKSYITKEAVMKMKYVAVRETTLVHTLFGGAEDRQKHLEYKIYVSDARKKYHCTFDVLDQEKICSEIRQIKKDFLSKELEDNGIDLTDKDCFSLCSSPTVHLLIGADIAGKLMTGKILNFTCGLTAVETLLGWTLLGKSPSNSESNSTMMVIDLLVNECNISDLWKLETIGISDPAESREKAQMHQDAMDYFRSTLKINEEGRYEIALPWVLESCRLPDNRRIAEKRLHSVYKKLVETDKVKVYTDVFDKWITEGIIEEVEDNQGLNIHYLPHRPVIKESSVTTKVRPVFDASAHEKGTPSLNACLETGPNMIELVPSLLNRFRKFPVAVTSDIERAFLQIGIREKDREYLRFLWKDEEGKMKIYRHCRVVFGVTCSPFLLAATLDYHLEKSPEILANTAQILRTSFYVDNCVCSLKDMDEANKFILEARELMSTGKFNLRGWQSNAPLEHLDGSENQIVPLLGLNWNVQEDTLSCNVNQPKEEELILTKRLLLSLVQRIFDPLGISSPVTIIPKLMLQESWNLGLKWDDILPEDLSKRFLNWLKKIQCLSEVKIPRWMKLAQSEEETVSLHIFCDASAKSYATCIFLRVETRHEVFVRFVQSRARVSPLKNITIPRLELLACSIGSRLSARIVEDLKLENLTIFYWTDSTTALSWIKRDSPWGTFVWNRVCEIRTLTDVERWRHIPGKLNPADCPSRGCSAEQFLHLKWWEGPLWLRDSEENWPQGSEEADEDLINAEKRKTVLSAHNHTESTKNWYHGSSHLKNVRILAWIQRFCNNCRKISTCTSPSLSCLEIKDAENLLMLLIQKEVFDGSSDPRLRSLNVVIDKNGLLRVKTRLIYRQDTEDFKYPVILPGDHPTVVALIMYQHKDLMHCGNQILLARLREKYWILKGRKSIRKILKSCVRCRRFNSKSVEMNLPPLPEDRIKDAGVFEVSGVDLAGPLFLRDGSKAWIALFTCAVYRGIHLELLSSLSTECFLLALRRFIARRGRPSVVYSDNGTNFIGTNRLLHSIDWRKIDEDGKKKDIIWKFIPPSAPWWGGWWERLIALVKDILKKVLGRAFLKYEELNTVLCDCEDIVNSRPITYIAEEDDLEPLTPSMFLREPRKNGILNLEKVEVSGNRLRKRQQYKCTLQEHLRTRFRLEYLGQLREQTKKIRNTREFKVGEIVIVEVPNQKRLNWPLGKILEVFPGKDGTVRLTRVKTKNGELLRPVQRLYALEVQAPLGEDLREKQTCGYEHVEETRPQQDVIHPEKLEESSLNSSPEQNAKTTRLGREIRIPKRLNL